MVLGVGALAASHAFCAAASAGALDVLAVAVALSGALGKSVRRSCLSAGRSSMTTMGTICLVVSLSSCVTSESLALLVLVPLTLRTRMPETSPCSRASSLRTLVTKTPVPGAERLLISVRPNLPSIRISLIFFFFAFLACSFPLRIFSQLLPPCLLVCGTRVKKKKRRREAKREGGKERRRRKKNAWCSDASKNAMVGASLLLCCFVAFVGLAFPDLEVLSSSLQNSWVQFANHALVELFGVPVKCALCPMLLCEL